jgi:hypothetical protein
VLREAFGVADHAREGEEGEPLEGEDEPYDEEPSDEDDEP